MRSFSRILITLALTALLFTPAARAQFTVTFNPAAAILQPGDSLTLAVTLLNNTAETVDLTAVNLSVSGPDITALTIDDTEFLTNLPLFLGVSDSYTGDLFLELDLSAPGPDYAMGYTIEAEGQDTQTTYTASGVYSLAPAAAAAPEPGTLALLLPLLAGLRWAARNTVRNRRFH